MCETLNAKNTPLSTTPTATPAARLWVAMVTTTVASMAALDRRGWRTRAPSDFQSNVSADTITMMATSAITGTLDTQSFSATMRMSKNTPANNVDRRPRPPYFTLPTAWPIIPQPAMPPNRLAAMLATPSPAHSRFLSLGVSVSSSTTAAVSTDSSRPTMAIASAGSRMMRRVSSDAGTCGSANTGNASGSLPRSPTMGRCSPSADASTVSTTTQISGDGMAVSAGHASRWPSHGRP
ncbi:hypothetical protein D3C71_926820 [compost metagenome]